MSNTTEVGFEHGVLWVIARLIEMYGEETQAAELLAESGIDISIADEADRPYLEIAKADPMYTRRCGQPKPAAPSAVDDRMVPIRHE